MYRFLVMPAGKFHDEKLSAGNDAALVSAKETLARLVKAARAKALPVPEAIEVIRDDGAVVGLVVLD